MYAIPHQNVEVPFLQHVLQGDRQTPSGATRSALIIHGGGSSCAARFQGLRDFLHGQGVETLAFDCVGHGRTGGPLLGTTLHQRVQQVQAVLGAQKMVRSALTLVGFSMGAYVVAKVAVAMGVQRLCLAVPAAYATQAYDVPFGPAFSQILRTPGSWETSDAFDVVRGFTGHLLVVSAERDSVIPSAIPLRYATARGPSSATVHLVVKDAGHQLIPHFAEAPDAQRAVYAQVAALCNR
jgi:pimeloyl-ACP methyl ester carboxylesterase